MPDEDKPWLRVAVYCRVSTDSGEQATSFEAQIEHYMEYEEKYWMGIGRNIYGWKPIRNWHSQTQGI